MGLRKTNNKVQHKNQQMSKRKRVHDDKKENPKPKRNKSDLDELLKKLQNEANKVLDDTFGVISYTIDMLHEMGYRLNENLCADIWKDSRFMHKGKHHMWKKFVDHSSDPLAFWKSLDENCKRQLLMWYHVNVKNIPVRKQ